MLLVLIKKVFLDSKAIRYGLGQQGMVQTWYLAFQKVLKLTIRIGKKQPDWGMSETIRVIRGNSCYFMFRTRYVAMSL